MIGQEEGGGAESLWEEKGSKGEEGGATEDRQEGGGATGDRGCIEKLVAWRNRKLHGIIQMGIG